MDTPFAVTSTESPAETVQPPAMVKVTVAPPLLVTQLFKPHCRAVVVSSTVYKPLELNTVPVGAARVIVE